MQRAWHLAPRLAAALLLLTPALVGCAFESVDPQDEEALAEVGEELIRVELDLELPDDEERTGPGGESEEPDPIPWHTRTHDPHPGDPVVGVAPAPSPNDDL